MPCSLEQAGVAGSDFVDDVNRTIEQVLDGSAPAARVVFRL
jgi:hypothetical protein